LARASGGIVKMAPATEVMLGRARLSRGLLAAALFACSPLTASAQDARGTIDFGQNTGAPPAHFEFVPAGEGERSTWALMDDGTAAGGLAIGRRGSPSTAGDSLAIYDAASPKDAEISLRIKATSGKEDQGGGIALRLTGLDSYYLVEMDARRDRVVFLRVANGAAEEIVGVDADIATDEWHRLAVRAADDEFVVTLDGIWVFTGFDKTLSRAGRVALWTKGDSITRFDQIEIEPLQEDRS
jgi:hypothetical protein